MKKLVFAILLMVAMLALVWSSINVWPNYTRNNGTAETILLESISIQHPEKLHIFAPDEDSIHRMFNENNFEHTRLVVILEDLSEVTSDILSYGGSSIVDTVNENGLRVVVTDSGPPDAETARLYRVLFTDKNIMLTNFGNKIPVTMSFQITCDDSGKGYITGDNIPELKMLTCQEARDAIDTMVSSAHVFDRVKLQSNLQKSIDENNERFEHLKAGTDF